jgi:serine/threonine protein kinase
MEEEASATEPLESSPETVRRISHFRIFELLGRGGMGEVYRAHDENLDRYVALKIIRPSRRKRFRLTGGDRPKPHLAKLREDKLGTTQSERFTSEAQVTGRLDHPNIVPIYELGTDPNEGVFFSMKLVDGDTLTMALREDGHARLRPDRLAYYLQVLIKICEAVSFAHNRGVIHRDLKPSNIMVGEYGQVYLMDWGVAFLMASLADPESSGRPNRSFGKVVGTIRYMSPEQVQGRHDQVDERSDVFSLGATLYHILTGHAPYMARTLPTLLRQALACEFIPADLEVGTGAVPKALAQITTRAMATNPADRYQTVLELQKAAEAFLRGSWDQPVRAFSAGEQIVVQGEEGDAAYVIVEGRCAVIDSSGPERVVLREMGPGDVFGETAVFSSTRRTATVEALEDVTVTMVTRDTLTSGLGLSSWLGRFVRGLADRFSEVDLRRRELERLHRPDEHRPDET